MKRTYPISVKLLSAMHINGGTDVNGTRITVRSPEIKIGEAGNTVRSGGDAYIPATLFKGLVRENFSKLWKMAFPEDIPCKSESQTEAVPCKCMTCRMFGAAGFQRSRIYFDNLEPEYTLFYERRTNVSIDRHLRKAVDQALVFTEIVSPIAYDRDNNFRESTFRGEMTVYYLPELSEDRQKQIEAVLIQAVRMITNIGLGKSRGLGFTETKVSMPEEGALCQKK